VLGELYHTMFSPEQLATKVEIDGKPVLCG
jgi:hypothetical protein